MDNLTVDRMFTFSYVNFDAFYSNIDYTQFSVVELPGFKKWSQYKEDKLIGYDIDQERMIINSVKAPKLKYDDLISLFKSKVWTDD